jgi:serine acetyltransferase
MVHPNCSILGHLEIAEKINVAPMSVDKTHPMMRCHFRRFIE